jgi:hemolysin-activating ACP:hemolysin acyltransferase
LSICPYRNSNRQIDIIYKIEFGQALYQPTAEDYKQNTSDDLWGIEFIAPFGHTRNMMRAIRNTTKELYGTTNQVHFRRFYNRNKLHKRMF